MSDTFIDVTEEDDYKEENVDLNSELQLVSKIVAIVAKHCKIVEVVKGSI